MCAALCLQNLPHFSAYITKYTKQYHKHEKSFVIVYQYMESRCFFRFFLVIYSNSSCSFLKKAYPRTKKACSFAAIVIQLPKIYECTRPYIFKSPNARVLSTAQSIGTCASAGFPASYISTCPHLHAACRYFFLFIARGEITNAEKIHWLRLQRLDADPVPGNRLHCFPVLHSVSPEHPG